MSKPKKVIVVGSCSYCGAEGELEPEHVVPRALFIDVNQANIIINACDACNGEKSDGENDLRDYMATAKRTKNHPVAKRLRSVIDKATKKGTSRVAARMMAAQSVPRMTQEGIYLGYDMLDNDDHFPEMERTLQYIVRGLHFHETKVPVLPSTEVDVRVMPYEIYPYVVNEFDVPFLPKRRILGPDVFSWQPIGLGSTSGSSYWILRFYDGVAVLGMIGGQLGLPSRPSNRSHRLVLKNPKGRRERALKRIVDRELVTLPPENILEFLHEMAAQHQESNSR